MSAEGFVPVAPRVERVAPSFTDAFDELYRGAYRTAFRLLGAREDAEDVAQEACARACMRWTRFADPAAWVARVTANLALDRWRRLRTAAQHRSDVIDLHRSLESLPGRQRQVVVRSLADLSEEQTARALGCAPGTVKSHASSGLAALRVALGDTEEA